MRWLFIKAFLLMSPCAVFLFELALVKWLVKPSRRFLNWFAAIGLLGACKFTGFAFLGGNDFNPELPQWLIIAWGWLESVIWVGLPISVVALVFAKFVKPFRKLAFGTVLTLSLIVAAWGMWEGVRVPPVVEREVEIEDLPKEFDGYRLAHISDLHCSSAARRGKIAAIVERTNAAKPDIIAITGDFVDGFADNPKRVDDLSPLADLRAKDGVFACTGNHEGYYMVDEWMPYYRKWNVKFLRNEWTTIKRGDATLALGGEEDDVLGGSPLRMFAMPDPPPNACRILMRHQPLECEFTERMLKVRLQLSGHTHGGAMPIFDKFVAWCNQGHVRGFYREGKLTLYVSPGSGQWAGFPLRFFNPPEIAILVLRSGAVGVPRGKAME